MNLFILEKKLNFIEIFFFKILLKDSDLIIDPFNYNQNNIKLNESNKINFTNLLPKIINKSKKIFLNKFKKQSENFSEFIEMKVSEINYSDKYWKIFFFREYLKLLLNKKKISKIYLFTEDDFMLHNSLKDIYKKKLFTHTKLLKYFFYIIRFIKIFYVYLNNFTIELYNSFFIEKKKKIKGSKNLLLANFPRDWNDKNLNYKFLNNNTKKFSILISISRNNSNILKYYSKSKIPKEFYVLESYISFFKVFKIYIGSLIKIFRNYNKIKNICKEIGLDFIFFEVILNYNLIESSKNSTLRTGLKNFLSYNKKFKKVITPMFEFIEGRIYNNFFNSNNIKTASFQHSIIMTSHITRIFISNYIIKKVRPNYLPAIIFVEGKKISKIFKSHKINSIVVGAARINDQLIRRPKIKNNINILYIDELYDKKYLFALLNFINKDKEIYKDNYKYIIRLHPANYEKLSKIVLNYEKKNPKIFLDRAKSIEDSILINNINLCISSSCTSFFDLLQKNCLCFFLKKKNLSINTPFNFKHKKLYLDNFNDVKRKINKYKNHNIPTKKFLKNFINFTGIKSEKRINVAINKL